METITIEYDKNNAAARSMVNALKKFDCFKVRKPRKTELELAIEEVERGDGTVCEDFDDYLRKVHS